MPPASWVLSVGVNINLIPELSIISEIDFLRGVFTVYYLLLYARYTISLLNFTIFSAIKMHIIVEISPFMVFFRNCIKCPCRQNRMPAFTGKNYKFM
jgi:hypothetical protein